MDGAFRENMSGSRRRFSLPGTLFVVIIARPAKGGDTIFYKLSSGGIKNPAA